MLGKKKNQIQIHERLFKDVEQHIQNTSFESVSAFVHHVMADICSTGDFSLGGDIPKAEADLIKKRLEALGYIDPDGAKPLILVHGGLKDPVNLYISHTP